MLIEEQEKKKLALVMMRLMPSSARSVTYIERYSDVVSVPGRADVGVNVTAAGVGHAAVQFYAGRHVAEIISIGFLENLI